MPNAAANKASPDTAEVHHFQVMDAGLWWGFTAEALPMRPALPEEVAQCTATTPFQRVCFK